MMKLIVYSVWIGVFIYYFGMVDTIVKGLATIGLYHLLSLVWYSWKRRSSRQRTIASTENTQLEFDESVPDGKLRIYVVCDNRSITGTHAFCFFRWTDHIEQRRYAARAEVRAQQDTVFDFSSTDQACISVEFVDGATVLQERKLFDTPYPHFAEFEVEVPLRNVKPKIKCLKNSSITYHSAGNHPSTQFINGQSNNQNCATWCAKALQEFGINLLLDEEKLLLIRTPKDIVNLAEGSRDPKRRVTRHIIERQPPPRDLLRIFVGCSSQSTFGSHAYMLFEWFNTLRSERMFKRAELLAGEPDEASYCNSVSRDHVVIRLSETKVGVEGGESLIKNIWPYFASFQVKDYAKNEDMATKLDSLATNYNDGQYSISGNHPSLAIANSNENNQNCASWVAKVLKYEFGIDLGLDNEIKRNLVLSPWALVNIANHYQAQ